MTQEVTAKDWEAARTTFYRVLNNWDDQNSDVQAQMTTMMGVIQDNLEIFEKRRKAEERARQAARNATAKQRKALRDELIPQWCVDNLKPGVIVKVKAANTRLRLVQELGELNPRWGGSLTGRHVNFTRYRDEDGVFKSRAQLGSYITDHTYKNVQGVVTGFDARGRAVVTPIMDLVEGRKDINLTAAQECAKVVK